MGHRRSPTTIAMLLILCFFFGLTLIRAEECDVPDVGVLSVGRYKFKTSLTHYWEGAVNGVDTKNADRLAGLYDLDLFYLLDAESADDWMGNYSVLVVSTQASFGYGIEGKVGTFYDLNDGAKGDHDIFIDKLFVEFTGLDRRLTWNIGKIDMIDYFDHSAVANEYKTQFFAYPLVQNQAIPFPSKGLGIRAIYEPAEDWFVQAAIADAQAQKRETVFRTTFHDEDHFFSVIETGVRPRFWGLDGTYRLTLWYDPQDKEYLDGSVRSKRDDLGFGLSMDQQIDAKTTLFFRYGWADESVHEIEDFVSFGLEVKEPIEGRSRDVFAVGYASGLRSPDNLGFHEERELDFVELYYRIQINDDLHVSPNLQLVMDPGNSTGESPATIFGLRCRYTF
ncbi:MAG: carbohydrate porin [Sedimentisphaerales bacterium]|nr:carbohydrate porin [Sedimentisphaerales bacterium]